MAGVFEGLPDRSLGHLTITEKYPDPVGAAVDVPTRQGDANADCKPLPERAGCDLDPGQDRHGMALQAAAEAPEGEKLLFADCPGRSEERVEEGRGVPLGEDQVVIVRIRRVIEIVVQVLCREYSDEIRGREGRCRMAGAGPGAGSDAVHA